MVQHCFDKNADGGLDPELGQYASIVTEHPFTQFEERIVFIVKTMASWLAERYV